MMRDDILGGVFERDFVFGSAERLYIFEGMDIKTSESIPPATPAAGFHGGGCNPPASVHVGENVGESNKSIPGYRRCPPGGNAGKLIPKCNGIPLSHARTSSFVAPRDGIPSTLPPTRANARNERWALEFGGFSRGNSARRSNDYILHHLSLPISIYFYTRRGAARAGCDMRPCDTQPSPAAI